jgi:SAM-dependent methyltransferase
VDDALYRLHAEREESYWWFVAKNHIILSLIDRFAPPLVYPAGTRPRAADIGCGCGGLLARLNERYDAVGTDMSPLARQYCAKRGLTALDGALPDRLPEPLRTPGTFDVVVCSEVLEHVEADASAAAAIVDLLRPGGLLICTVPAHMFLWSNHDVQNHHFRRYAKRGFEALFAPLPVKPLVVSYANAALFPLLAAARLGKRLLGRDDGEASIRPLPAPVNALFRGLFAAEARPLRRGLTLPVGSSVIGAFRRV